ncbi:hypothetical protein L249_4050 [Ophiocordyceps polyrhachis-furcata BCC 54312]|uniref:Uncharacterized protein n=1 Tax=Ophiocordyceps polyrhachis-furcata BCC 54312 TaxID=1330021 RepID=A0A367L5Q6_9HYPO|nr:hypothetical protein L249_4050 [Ophiocordyceps polyrhachis-furcata BCC 54312]
MGSTSSPPSCPTLLLIHDSAFLSNVLCPCLPMDYLCEGNHHHPPLRLHPTLDMCLTRLILLLSEEKETCSRQREKGNESFTLFLSPFLDISSRFFFPPFHDLMFSFDAIFIPFFLCSTTIIHCHDQPSTTLYSTSQMGSILPTASFSSTWIKHKSHLKLRISERDQLFPGQTTLCMRDIRVTPDWAPVHFVPPSMSNHSIAVVKAAELYGEEFWQGRRRQSQLEHTSTPRDTEIAADNAVLRHPIKEQQKRDRDDGVIREEIRARTSTSPWSNFFTGIGDLRKERGESKAPVEWTAHETYSYEKAAFRLVKDKAFNITSVDSSTFGPDLMVPNRMKTLNSIDLGRDDGSGGRVSSRHTASEEISLPIQWDWQDTAWDEMTEMEDGFPPVIRHRKRFLFQYSGTGKTRLGTPTRIQLSIFFSPYFSRSYTSLEAILYLSPGIVEYSERPRIGSKSTVFFDRRMRAMTMSLINSERQTTHHPKFHAVTLRNQPLNNYIVDRDSSVVPIGTGHTLIAGPRTMVFIFRFDMNDAVSTPLDSAFQHSVLCGQHQLYITASEALLYLRLGTTEVRRQTRKPSPLLSGRRVRTRESSQQSILKEVDSGSLLRQMANLFLKDLQPETFYRYMVSSPLKSS